MKRLFYFALGFILGTPAAFLLFSGELVAEIILCVYMAILWLFLPKKILRRIIWAHYRFSKNLLEE